MAYAVMGVHAPEFQPRPADVPDDYFNLLRELTACSTKEQLRHWALETGDRRRALPQGVQARLREHTINQQRTVWRNAYGNAAPVIAERDADHIGTVTRRLLDVVTAHANILTTTEARDFADAIRNVAGFHAPVTVIEGSAIHG